MGNRVKRIRLFYNDNDKSIKIALSLNNKLLEYGYEVVYTDNFDLGIAIGGDGSFLRMVKNCQFRNDVYYIGVNTGTLGFAQEIYPNDIDLFLDNLSSNNYKIDNVGIQSNIVETRNSKSEFYSLNEILIRDKNLNTSFLDVFINEKLLENFVGDGVLVSTSFGSTAYNLSYGGSIVYNDLHTMQITPVAPLSNKSYQVLRNSVIIPEDRIINIRPNYRIKDLLLTNDGDNQVYDDVLNIDISVKKKIKFLRMNDYDYTKKINEKFL